jgi:hypothetical protein
MKRLIVICIVLSLPFAGCGFEKRPKYVAGQPHEKWKYYQLEKAETIDSFLCDPGGLVSFHENGRLYRFALAESRSVTGQPLPRGTLIAMSPEGTLDWCFLPRDSEIQGHLCKGRSDNWATSFYPNGKLKTCWLAHDQVIQRIPCGEATFLSEISGGKTGTQFYDNGQLAGCRLAGEITIQSVTFKKGEHLQLNREGKVVR